ncbi:MAG: peptidase M23 [Flavobacteriaceae bacterium]|nr:MAG: peptidase M23 [Flavobacteriaceae bacterium]
MEKNKKKGDGFRKKLTHKYRLVILNEDTFEEKVSFKLTRLNVFILSGIFSILLIIGTIFFIAFTPLKEYIPGYSSTNLKRKASTLVYKVDSLQQELLAQGIYINSVKEILTGKIKEVHFNKDSILQSFKINKDSMDVHPSQADSLFRLEIEQKERFNLFEEAQKNLEIVFFAPVTGTITDKYNVKNRHFAVDVAVNKDTPVKAVADGMIIFADWTADTGHVVLIQHASGFISVYKHNASIHKKQGELVVSGEVIASAGSTGELSTGPHLHFELWTEGYPVDPSKFIDFE